VTETETDCQVEVFEFKALQRSDQLRETLDEGSVRAFDFAILIPLVLELLVPWLRQCLGQDVDIAAEVKRGGFWARYAVRTCTRRAARSVVGGQTAGIQRHAEKAVLSAAAELTEAQLAAICEEITTRVPDFSSVWS